MTTPAPRPGPAAAPGGPPGRAVARLRGAAEVAAAVPALVGFVPTESLVVVSLRGRRARVGLVARVDLPAAGAAEVVLAGLVRALAADGAERVVAFVWSAEPVVEPGPLPRAALVLALRSALLRRRLPLDDALLVQDGRWWSYSCTGPCCPPGAPLPSGTPALSAVRAAGALAGRAVLPDRAALAASVATPGGQAAQAAHAAVAAARREQEREAARVGRSGTASRLLAVVRGAVADASRAPGDDLPAAVVATVALALQDVPVRDQVLRWLPARGEDLLTLLLQVARRTAPPDDAGVCAALGAAAYVLGDGALAHLALDRALRTEPQHGLALLLSVALEACVPPATVRAVLAGPSRRERRGEAQRPRTA